MASGPRAPTVALLEMARRLDIKGVVEGIETRAIREALKAIRCDMVQGYFVAEPVPESRFAKHVAQKPRMSP